MLCSAMRSRGVGAACRVQVVDLGVISFVGQDNWSDALRAEEICSRVVDMLFCGKCDSPSEALRDTEFVELYVFWGLGFSIAKA